MCGLHFKVFETLHIPIQVAKEVEQPVALIHLETFSICKVKIHYISPEQIKSSQNLLRSSFNLQYADLEVFSLAQKRKPDFVLTDDLPLRLAFESQHYTVMGSVGLLLYAYKAKILNQEKLEQAIDRLFMQSSLYLSPQFKTYVRKLIKAKVAE